MPYLIEPTFYHLCLQIVALGVSAISYLQSYGVVKIKKRAENFIHAHGRCLGYNLITSVKYEKVGGKLHIPHINLNIRF